MSVNVCLFHTAYSTLSLAKERGGLGGAFEDDVKFESNWRREGPLPDLPGDSRGDPSRRRFEGERPPPPSGVSDGASDWRSAGRAPVRVPSGDSEPRVKRMGFGGTDTTPGAADAEQTWSKGSKFKPSAPAEEAPGSKFGGGFKRTEAPAQQEESDWRRGTTRPMSRGSRMFRLHS